MGAKKATLVTPGEIKVVSFTHPDTLEGFEEIPRFVSCGCTKGSHELLHPMAELCSQHPSTECGFHLHSTSTHPHPTAGCCSTPLSEHPEEQQLTERHPRELSFLHMKAHCRCFNCSSLPLAQLNLNMLAVSVLTPFPQHSSEGKTPQQELELKPKSAILHRAR